MHLEQGSIIAIRFKVDNYVDFINYAFSNVLISGVDVQFQDYFGGRVLLFVRLSVPGVDRIEDVIFKYDGEVVC